MNKITQIIISSLIAAGIFIVLVWISQSSVKNQGTNSVPAEGKQVLVSQEPVYDFGDVSMAAGLVNHNFTIANQSDEPVKITKIYTSCMCTTASLIKNGNKRGSFEMPGHGFGPKIDETFLPGEEAVIEVIFDPSAHGPAGIGAVERAVYLENDSGLLLELLIKAVVIP